MLRRSNSCSGFTLVELMAVVVIIAILSAIILGTAEFAKRQAREARAKGEIEKLKIAAQEFKMKYGSYPPLSVPSGTWTVQDLIDNAKELTNYMVESVSYVDPWDNPYQYEKHSRHFGAFLSYGADGLSGNDDEKLDDIRSGR